MKPLPSSPIIFLAGTLTSSKARMAVSEAFIPSLDILDLVIPLESIGTTISDLLAWALPSLVFARRQAQSDCIPLVIHILVPFITKSSPSLRALVVRLATSLPPPGSLTAIRDGGDL